MDQIRLGWRAPVTDDAVATVRMLAAASEAALGHPAIGDAAWRDLAAPGDRSAVGIASRGDAIVGAVHLAPAENEPERLTASLVVHPDRVRDPEVAHVLADATLDRARAIGADRVVVWLFGPSEGADAAITTAGFRLERELGQLRAALPIGEEPHWPVGIEVRAFESGRDEEAWLEANNRAFADDPDQHDWTLATLRRRLAEPWFDPAGLLLAFDGAGLAGSCWTRLHPPAPPHEPEPLGEIYVIGVDPARQGTGLGHALVVAGLRSLHDRGAAEGMLFVDSSNKGAVRLYRKLGFDISRIDRAYGASLR